MQQAAMRAAQTKEQLADIVNVIVEELVRQRFELPAFSRFVREAIAARATVNRQCFELVDRTLTSYQKAQIDKWLETTTDEGWSWWRKLKYEPPAPTVHNIKNYLQHIAWLHTHFMELDVQVEIPEAKRKQFAYEAYACDLPHLNQFPPAKRRTFTMLLLERQMAKGLDDLVQMFIRRMYRLRNDAKTLLEQYHEKNRDQLGELIEQLVGISSAFQSEGTELERFRAIQAVMPEQPETLIDRCYQHLAYAQNNHLLCLLPLYKNKRFLLFGCIEALNLKSSTQDRDLLNALEYVFQHRSSRKEWVEIEDSGEGTLHLDWIPDK